MLETMPNMLLSLIHYQQILNLYTNIALCPCKKMDLYSEVLLINTTGLIFPVTFAILIATIHLCITLWSSAHRHTMALESRLLYWGCCGKKGKGEIVRSVDSGEYGKKCINEILNSIQSHLYHSCTSAFNFSCYWLPQKSLMCYDHYILFIQYINFGLTYRSRVNKVTFKTKQ